MPPVPKTRGYFTKNQPVFYGKKVEVKLCSVEELENGKKIIDKSMVKIA